MTLRYTDIDPNVIELISQKLQSPLEKLIEDKIQRRQQWGPTFKQEDIAELQMTDADFIIPAPEYGKRVLRMGGSGLTVQRVVRIPPIPSAWWIVHNRTSQALKILTDPTGTVGPVIPPDQVGACYTDGIGVWQFACCGGEEAPGGEDMPGGDATEIQYKLNATTFGGVDGSTVDVANVGWQGTHTINKAGNRSYEWLIDPGITATSPTVLLGADNRTYLGGQRFSNAPSEGVLIDLLRGRGDFSGQADVIAGDIVGTIGFRCIMSGVPMVCGAVQATHDGTGGAIAIGHTDGVFSANGDHSVGLYQGPSDARSFEIGDTGFLFSHGIKGSTFYVDHTAGPTGLFKPVPMGSAGQVLTLDGSPAVPIWKNVAGASFPSLDQVTNPAADKGFVMGSNTLGFSFTGNDTETCYLIQTDPNATGFNPVLLVRNQGTTSNKVPFQVDANGLLSAFIVNASGRVGVRMQPPTPSPPAAFNGDFNVAGISVMNADNFTTASGRTLQVAAITSTFANGRGSAGFLGQESGVLGSGTVYSNVRILTIAQFSGPGSDVRGVWADTQYAGSLSSPQIRGIVSSFDPIGASIPVSGSFVAFYAPGPTIPTAATLAGAYVGVGITKSADTWGGGQYGIITAFGMLNGFGFGVGGAINATLHVNGSVQFDLPGGGNVKGDVYYRDGTTGQLVALHNPGDTSWNGRVLTLSGGLPVWATVTGGPSSATPGGSLGNLQYHTTSAGSPAFGGISSTEVGNDLDGLATLGLGPNQLTVGTKDGTSYIALKAITTSNTQILIQSGHVSQVPTLLYRRSAASLGNLANNEVIGKIEWQARAGGAWPISPANHGSITAIHHATNGTTIRIISGTSHSRLEVFETTVKITAINASPNWTYEYTSIGPKWLSSTGTHGLRGALYYVGAGAAFDHLKALPIGTTLGHVLTVTEPDPTGSPGAYEPRWVAATGGPGSGIPSTGGNTNAIQYRSGAGTTTLGGVNTSAGVLIASAANGVASFSTTFPAVRFFFSPGTQAGLNVGQWFSDPASLNSSDGDIFYNSGSGKFRVRENGVWQDMRGGGIGSPGGDSTKQIQFNNGGSFDGIFGSTVDTAGVITLKSAGALGVNMILQSDYGAGIAIQTAQEHADPATAAIYASSFRLTRSRGTIAFRTGVITGDHLGYFQAAGYVNSSSFLIGTQIYSTVQTTWTTTSAPTVMRLRTTHINGAAPLDRIIVGGSKVISAGVLAPLFTISYANADHMGMGGEVHLVFVAKQLSPSVQTQVTRRKINFTCGHNGSSGTGAIDIREDGAATAGSGTPPFGAQSQVSSFGGLTISHQAGASATQALDQEISQGGFNFVTYSIMATSDQPNVTITCYYHIIYHGEKELTLV